MYYFVAASILTLLAYGMDKRRSQNQDRRVPEATLHLMSLAGGWPGALVGQHLFRHKRRKSSFMVVFWLTVALNGAVLFGLIRFGVI